MSTMNRLRATEVSPRAAGTALVVLLLAMIGVVVFVVKTSNGSSSVEVASPRPSRTARMTATRGENGTTAGGARVGGDYGIIAKRNLFRPVAGPEKPGAKVTLPQLPDFPKDGTTASAVSVPPFQPRGGMPAQPTGPRLAYTGRVELPAGEYALIENLATNESQYTRIGEMAFGYLVIDVTDRVAILQRADDMSDTMMLNMGDNKVEVAAKEPAAPENGDAAKQPGDASPANGAQPSGQQSRTSSRGMSPDMIRNANPEMVRRFRGRAN